jgi:hypothetical protein
MEATARARTRDAAGMEHDAPDGIGIAVRANSNS